MKKGDILNLIIQNYEESNYLPNEEEEMKGEGQFYGRLSGQEQLEIIRAQNEMRKMELEYQRRDAETQKDLALAQMKEAEAQRRHELEVLQRQDAMARAAAAGNASAPQAPHTPVFDVAKNLRLRIILRGFSSLSLKLPGAWRGRKTRGFYYYKVCLRVKHKKHTPQ